MQEQLVYWDETQQRYVALKPGEQPPQGAIIASVPQRSIFPAETDIPKSESTASLSDIQPKDVVSGGLRALGMLAPMLVPGAGLPSMALRGLTAAAPSAGAAAIEGGNPVEEAAFQTGLGMTGELGGKAIPYGANALALAIGNIRHGLKGLRGLGQTAEAFTRDADRAFFPVLVGRSEEIKKVPILEKISPSSQRVRKLAGERLEQAEVASPVQTPLRDLAGSNVDYMDNAVNTMDPIGLRRNIASTERTLIEGQALARNGLTPEQFDAFTVSLHARLRQILPSYLSSQGLNPLQVNRLMNQFTLDKTKKVVMNELIDNTKLSARNLGELQRGISGEVRPLQQRIAGGEPVFAGEAEQAQITKNVMDHLRKIRHGPVDVGAPQTKFEKFAGREPKPGQAGSIKAADLRSSDAIRMDQANKQMRAGGMVGDLGLFSMRGALGGMAGPIIGMDPLTASIIAALGLHPQALSAAGRLGGSALKYFPTAVRGASAIESTQGVRRRRAEEKKK